MRNEGIADAGKAGRLRLAMLLAGIVAIVLAATAGVAYSIAKNVVINDNGVESRVLTFAGTVDQLLEAEKFDIDPKDEVTPSLDSEITDDMQVLIKRAVNITVNYGGEDRQIMSAKATVGEMIQNEGFEVTNDDMVEPSQDCLVEKDMTVTITRVVYQEIEEEVTVPFEKTRRLNLNLASGETKISRSGAEGLKKDFYRIKYINGHEESRELLRSEVIRQPVTEITEYSGNAGIGSRDGIRYKHVLEVEATAYHTGFNSRDGRPARTAAGMTLKRGIIAVDPKVIPLGTRLYVESPNGKWVYGYAVAGDTGGAIKGNKIDICLDTYAEAVQFGRRQMKVYILE